EFEGKDVVIGVGKFGPYIRHDGKFTSLPKTYQPLEVTLEESTSLILEKRKEESSKIIKTFETEPDLQIINGRFGAYISYQKSNYKIPKEMKPEDMTIEECKNIIAAQGDKPKKRAPKRAKRKE
ncbi:MAG: topoisomerase C-terminal repeat-containing protein, partial [Bacteroidales bacterium]